MSSREIKPKVLLTAFLKAGFEIKRQRGSHVFVERTQRLREMDDFYFASQ